ncbi:hypothetical protein GLOIN_2v1779760 [Rhizophagus irregularis DAOM 181602=DAOM 197198]|nr:hypothetical protein GLOIN_2v1779760 [Rhizophagus irregularis DAOM 181602=DAOM 197198]
MSRYRWRCQRHYHQAIDTCHKESPLETDPRFDKPQKTSTKVNNSSADPAFIRANPPLTTAKISSGEEASKVYPIAFLIGTPGSNTHVTIRLPQQIQLWNRLTKSVLHHKAHGSSMSLKPYLLNEVKAGSRPYVVFKQVYHMPKRTKDWDSVDREMAAKRDGYHPTAVLRRTKNWIHRVKNLPLYNTNDDTWTSKKTIGDPPTPRAYHSAVLTQDGRIIVYGGIDKAATDDLVILDVSQADYTWSRANVSTKSPLSRSYHTATLVGHYMFVIFGKNNEFLLPTTPNEVFILDTSDKSNYKWVSEFDPNLILPTPPTAPTPPRTPTPPTTQDQNLSTQNRNLGIIILPIVLILIGASFLIYFYRKRRLSRLDMFVHFPQIN